jgi:hypothetical protein
VATSSAIHGCRIGQADGPDRARPGLFAKKFSNFSRINPQSRPPLRFFFAKKPSDFTEINPQSRPFKWVGLPPCGPVYHVPGPYWAEFGPTMFSYFPANLLFIYNGSNFIKNIIKQIKIKKCKTKFVELYTTSTAL